MKNCGWGEIRTLDTDFIPYSGLAIRRFQPLSHPSLEHRFAMLGRTKVSFVLALSCTVSNLVRGGELLLRPGTIQPADNHQRQYQHAVVFYESEIKKIDSHEPEVQKTVHDDKGR